MYESVSEAEIESRIAECHESVRSIFSYWRDRCREGGMPRRCDIDPVDVRFHLPSIILVDVVADERRFVYRLVGTREVAGRGYDPTGMSVASSFYAASKEAALACYQYVVQECRPFCFKDPYVTLDGWHEQEDIIYLPISEDGVNVSMILVYSHSYNYRPRIGGTFLLR